MRQRLGLATALIGDPSVLILDEPANGLDPAGIRWMRGLLREFADRGGTVLLSSHLLHEIEVIADDLVVIGNGTDRDPGRQVRPARLGRSRWCARPNPQPLAAALGADRVASVVTSGPTACWPRPTPTRSGAWPSRPAYPSSSCAPADGTGLEEMFLQLTADTQRDSAPTDQTSNQPEEHSHDHRPAPRAPPHYRVRASAGHPAGAGSRRPSFGRCSTPGPVSGPWPASCSSRRPRPAW